MERRRSSAVPAAGMANRRRSSVARGPMAAMTGNTAELLASRRRSSVAGKQLGSMVGARRQSVAPAGLLPSPSTNRKKSILQEVFSFNAPQFGEQNEGYEQTKREKEERDRQLEALKEAKGIASDPVGLLAVHIKKLDIFDLDVYRLMKRYDINVYIRIWVDTQVKYTCMFERVTLPCSLLMDELKHLKIKTSAKRADRKNFLRFELVIVDPENSTRHRIVSTKEIHLFEIIKNMYDDRVLQLRSVDKQVAECEVELCFQYGRFGYGFSNQFENRQKTPKEQTNHSMYYRAEPHPDRLDVTHDVLHCRHVGYPAFIYFPRKSDLAPPGEDFGSEFNIHGVQQIEEPKLVIARIKTRMRTRQNMYERINTRSERVRFLRGLISSTYNHTLIDHDNYMVKSDFKLKTRQVKKGVDKAAAAAAEDGETGETDIGTMTDVLQKAHGVTLRENERGPLKKPTKRKESAAATQSDAPQASGLMAGVQALGTGLSFIKRKVSVFPGFAQSLFTGSKVDIAPRETSTTQAQSSKPMLGQVTEEEEVEASTSAGGAPGISITVDDTGPRAPPRRLDPDDSILGRAGRRLTQMFGQGRPNRPERPVLVSITPYGSEDEDED